MEQFDLSLMPTAVDVTLYKYNYIDNKLWAQLHNQADFIPVSEDSIMTSSSQLKVILETNYLSTINKIKTLGSEVVHKEINSVFFLYQMCLEMENLQYIKFNLNKDKTYSRMVEIEGKKMLQFSFKVITATLRLFDLYDEEELPHVNKILEELGILHPEKPYNRVFATELSNKIDMYVESYGEDDHNAGIVLDILDILEPKMEIENSLILLITDY
jgi:hypothetical protein